MKKRFWIKLILPVAAFIIWGLALPAAAERERSDDGFFTILDEDGEVICRTAHYITAGDEYLTAANKLYRVEKVEGDQAHARLVEEATLAAGPARQSLLTEIRRAATALFRGKQQPAQGEEEKRPVALFHTHSGESYVPSDGRPHIEGNGGVTKVGEAMARRLRDENVPVIHDRTSHDPQDAMAYDRSRRTVAELLQKNPIALIDIHRDAVPAEEYEKWIDGEKVTKVQFVVGRQNPNMQASDAFARQVKAEVDQKYPGLVKGIFYGSGKYNQDMAPRLLLIEVGTHTMEREAAEKGAEIFAAAAHRVLSTGAAAEQRGRFRDWRWLLWIAGFLGVGALIYLLLSGGWKRISRVLGGETGGSGTGRPQEESEPGAHPPEDGGP